MTNCMVPALLSHTFLKRCLKTMLVDFDKNEGLVPVIAQDSTTSEVLMLAYMDEAAFAETVNTGYAHYYSRSRKRMWKKGESSGHVQKIVEIRVDCDKDTILLIVEQLGEAACHEGYKSCFYRKVENGELITDKERIFDPDKVYKD